MFLSLSLLLPSGPWAPRKIPNSAYFQDLTPAVTLAPIGAIAVEVWTTNPGIYLDDFALSHSQKAAFTFARTIFQGKSIAESTKMKKEEEAQRQAAGGWVHTVSQVLAPLSPLVTAIVQSEVYIALKAQVEKQPYAAAGAAVALLLSVIYLLFASQPRRKHSATRTQAPAPVPTETATETATDAATETAPQAVKESKE